MNTSKKGGGIQTWAEDDRPREKMLKFGAKALSKAELLAILINSGNENENAVDLAKRILKDVHDNLLELSQLEINDLIRRYKGIGQAKAVTIKAALELGSRARLEEALQNPIINNSKVAFELLYPYLANQNEEHFYALYLNKANRPIGNAEEISKGGIDGTVADPRIIFRKALEKRAISIIIAHNHPSGNLTPSQQDEKLTQKIKDAAEFFDMKLLDHIIIGKQEYYSFADMGKI